jgi:hypothetical protein
MFEFGLAFEMTHKLDTDTAIGSNSNAFLTGHSDDTTSIILQDGLTEGSKR